MSENEGKKSNKKLKFGAVGVIALVVLLLLGNYARLFGKIEPYGKTGMKHFSKYTEEGGSGLDSASVKVRFNDGSTAYISGSIKYKLSLLEKNQLALHAEYSTSEAISEELVRQVVTEALMQTATLMKAEEVYSTRRSDFTSITEAQIKDGIYRTVAKEELTTDAEGNEFVSRTNALFLGKDGLPQVRKVSPFNTYNIEILQFVIKDIDFDETIDKLIAMKKESEQRRELAKTNSESAKQQALTAVQQGLAKEAEAEATANVTKIKATVAATQDKEVAELKAAQELAVAILGRQAAEENAQKELSLKRAEAEGNKLLSVAGLTPQERAEYDNAKAIGVARELAKVKFPQMMIIGGSGQGGAMNPFDAVGLKSFIEIQEQMSK